MEQITTEQLKQKINNGENFVLDLFATWCGPCKIMLYNLEKVNESLISESTSSPKYSIYKLDIDSDREYVVNELQIRSAKTLLPMTPKWDRHGPMRSLKRSFAGHRK